MRFDSEPRLVFLGGGGFFFFFTFVRDRLFRSFLTSLWLFSEVQTAIFRYVSRIYSLCMLGSDYIAFFSLIVDSDSSFENPIVDVFFIHLSDFFFICASKLVCNMIMFDFVWNFAK